MWQNTLKIEATSFLHYLEHKDLVTKEQVEEELRDAEGRSVCPPFHLLY